MFGFSMINYLDAVQHHISMYHCWNGACIPDMMKLSYTKVPIMVSMPRGAVVATRGNFVIFLLFYTVPMELNGVILAGSMCIGASVRPCILHEMYRK